MDQFAFESAAHAAAPADRRGLQALAELAADLSVAPEVRERALAILSLAWHSNDVGCAEAAAFYRAHGGTRGHTDPATATR